MRTTLSQQKFLDSEAAARARKELQRMVDDAGYNTLATYAAHLDHDLPFVEKHMKYLSDHPKLNPDHYLANLRLMTRNKR